MAKLESLDLQDLRNFQSLYKTEWPEYCNEYYMLSNFIMFKKLEPELKHLNAYTLEDPQAKKLGLFLIVDRYQLFVGCLGNSMKLMDQALLQLDWSRGLNCSAFRTRYLETILKVIRNKKLDIDLQLISNLYHLSKENALQLPIDCPKGFQLKPLSEQDAQLIDQEWPYSHQGTLFFLQRQIRLCPSMGIYDEQTHKLVAWCTRAQDGLLAALQVDNNYMRRGFGSLIVKGLSRSIAEMEHDITAEVHFENTASNNMFSQLGFEIIGNCHWVNTAPVNGKFTWPEGE